MILKATSDYRFVFLYLFRITTIFQTKTLIKRNNFITGGPPGVRGRWNCPGCPPLIRPWLCCRNYIIVKPKLSLFVYTGWHHQNGMDNNEKTKMKKFGWFHFIWCLPKFMQIICQDCLFTINTLMKGEKNANLLHRRHNLTQMWRNCSKWIHALLQRGDVSVLWELHALNLPQFLIKLDNILRTFFNFVCHSHFKVSFQTTFAHYGESDEGLKHASSKVWERQISFGFTLKPILLVKWD